VRNLAASMFHFIFLYLISTFCGVTSIEDLHPIAIRNLYFIQPQINIVFIVEKFLIEKTSFRLRYVL
jgi:hypothetical protein